MSAAHSLVVTLLLALCLGGALAQDERPLYVGLVRGDGIVVPFAAFDRTGEVDWDPRDLWWIQSWYFFGRDGSSAELRVAAVVELPDDWYDPWGHLTDLSPRDFDVGTLPVKRVGLAVSRPRELVIFETLKPEPDLEESLLASVGPAFERLEAQQLARAREAVASAARPKIESIAAAPLGTEGDSLYYVGLERRYPAAGDGNEAGACWESSLLYIWVIRRAGRRLLAEAKFFATDCEYKFVEWLDPLGILELDGRVLVLVEEYSWEQTERYVFELTDRGLRRTR